MRVLIADADEACRDELARRLRASGVDVVREVSSGEAAIPAAISHAPDVVIISPDALGPAAPELIRRVVAQAPATRVLVLGETDLKSEFTEALAMGADGYLRDDARPERLSATVLIAAALLSRRARVEKNAPQPSH